LAVWPHPQYRSIFLCVHCVFGRIPVDFRYSILLDSSRAEHRVPSPSPSCALTVLSEWDFVLPSIDSKLAALRAISRIYLKRVREAGGRAAFIVCLKQVARRASLIKMLSAIRFRPSSVVRNSEASALRTSEESPQYWRESLHLSSSVRLNLQSEPIRNAGLFPFASRADRALSCECANIQSLR
jgi:hypothetical protein